MNGKESEDILFFLKRSYLKDKICGIIKAYTINNVIKVVHGLSLFWTVNRSNQVSTRTTLVTEKELEITFNEPNSTLKIIRRPY